MPRISSAFALAAPLACLLIAPGASAHVELTSPAPRLAGSATQSQLKFGPCGQTANARTDTVTEYEPGETITVEFTEYINHPGYFRVAFDVDGDDDFGVRADMDSIAPGTDDPESLEPLDDIILAYIDDGPVGDYSVEVTLPNVECDNCTLQLIQFMYDKVGNGNDDEYYYQCADIVLSGEIVGGTGGADAGGSGGADAGAGGGTAAGGSDTGSGVGGGSVGAGGASIATGGAAAGGSTAAAGGNPGVVASGGASASGGSTTSSGGAGTDADGADAGMDDDSGEGGCAFQAPTKPGPFATLLVLFGLVGLLRRRAGA
jgi:hypothetical protein